MLKPNSSLFVMLMLIFMSTNNLTVKATSKGRTRAAAWRATRARQEAARRARARNQELKANARDEQRFKNTVQYLLNLMPNFIQKQITEKTTAHLVVAMRFAIIMFFHKNLLIKREKELAALIDNSYKDEQVAKLLEKIREKCPERATLRKNYQAIMDAYTEQQRDAQA